MTTKSEATSAPVATSKAPFFNILPTPTLTPEQESAAKMRICPDCKIATLHDISEAHGMLFLQCASCKGIVVLASASPAASAPVATSDAISRIVDRDTPPDGRNDVVDHDVRGKPITRGDVEAFDSATVATNSTAPCDCMGQCPTCRAEPSASLAAPESQDTASNLSQKLREYAVGKYEGGVAYATIMRQAADELDRFAAHVARPLPTDDLDMQTIRERDYNAEIADKLADGIAEHFGRDIGEHSSANCPWLNALEILNTKLGAVARNPPEMWIVFHNGGRAEGKTMMDAMREARKLRTPAEEGIAATSLMAAMDAELEQERLEAFITRRDKGHPELLDAAKVAGALPVARNPQLPAERVRATMPESSPLVQAHRAAVASKPHAAPSDAIATVVSVAGNLPRVGWLRPELCEVGSMLYFAAPSSQAAPSELTDEQIDQAWVTVDGGWGMVPRELARKYARAILAAQAQKGQP